MVNVLGREEIGLRLVLKFVSSVRKIKIKKGTRDQIGKLTNYHKKTMLCWLCWERWRKRDLKTPEEANRRAQS